MQRLAPGHNYRHPMIPTKRRRFVREIPAPEIPANEALAPLLFLDHHPHQNHRTQTPASVDPVPENNPRTRSTPHQNPAANTTATTMTARNANTASPSSGLLSPCVSMFAALPPVNERDGRPGKTGRPRRPTRPTPRPKGRPDPRERAEECQRIDRSGRGFPWSLGRLL